MDAGELVRLRVPSPASAPRVFASQMWPHRRQFTPGLNRIPVLLIREPPVTQSELRRPALAFFHGPGFVLGPPRVILPASAPDIRP